MFYRLDENKNAVPCDIDEWGKQRKDMFCTDAKHLGNDIIDGKRISTVWIGLNHNFDEIGEPLLFETMIFDNDGSFKDIYCDRYSTWKEAEEGHQKAIQWVKDGCKEKE